MNLQPFDVGSEQSQFDQESLSEPRPNDLHRMKTRTIMLLGAGLSVWGNWIVCSRILSIQPYLSYSIVAALAKADEYRLWR